MTLNMKAQGHNADVTNALLQTREYVLNDIPEKFFFIVFINSFLGYKHAKQKIILKY